MTHFSSLDLAQGYYQMGILESDKEKTAFKTVDGLYEFKTLTMGLTNAPSMFQSMMNTTFKGLEFCVIIYLDDILVFSRSEDDHIRDLELVLARLKLHGLIAKGSECCFFKPSLKFLGHVVSRFTNLEFRFHLKADYHMLTFSRPKNRVPTVRFR